MRGKHGQAAAVRHEVRNRDIEIATYQNAVARLTKERNEARVQLEEHRKSAAAIERDLRARLDHAASPKIDALETLIKARTDQRDEARARVRFIHDKWERAFRGLQEHFFTEHGLNGLSCTEAAAAILHVPGEATIMAPGTTITATKQEHELAALSPDFVRLIQRKAGRRS